MNKNRLYMNEIKSTLCVCVCVCDCLCAREEVNEFRKWDPEPTSQHDLKRLNSV